ncbi:MAG: SiaB family protein kinase [Halodesulfovibrio sp.]|uniref:SiaB family protein kinase n=1 Tax=Halodesulfovibrio sp. TaxID=1912772 RepID=UPI00359CD047
MVTCGIEREQMDFEHQRQQFERDEGVIFYFNGPVSQSVVEGIGDAVRAKMRHDAVGIGVTQKVFTILIEQMQNIVRYSTDRLMEDEFGAEAARGQVIIGQNGDGSYFISSGNRIRSEDATDLYKRIENVRYMSPDELKVLYKEERRKAKSGSEKGAGLGLIEMARKSGKPLDFAIEPLDEETSFFSMKVTA